MTTSISNNGGSNNFDEILDRCLRAVESGQMTVEQCVARYPNYPELDSLLRMAIAVRDLPRPQMPAAMTTQLQRRLQAQLREQIRVSAPRRASTFPLLRLLFTFGLILIILFGGGAGLVFASTQSLPGDLLYPVKRESESVRLNLASQTDRPGVLYDLAETRLKEISSLAARGTNVHETWVDDMSNSVDQAVRAQTDNTKRTQLTTDAETALQDALSKGKIDPAVAQTTIQRLQFNLTLYTPPTSTTTPTPAVAVEATTITPSAIPSDTATSTIAPTQNASVTLTPSFTASSTETLAPPTATRQATHTPTATATPTATVPLPVLGPSNTPTLGRGPAVTVVGQSTKARTKTPTATTPSSTEAATEPATEQASGTVVVTDTNIPTSTSTATFTATPTFTMTATSTPKPPTETPTATPTPTFTDTAVPTPNGLPAANLKQQPQETTFQNCKPEGTGGDPALNQLRNRVDEASQYPQTAFDSIAKFPWPKDAEGKPRAQWSPDTSNAIAQAEGLPVMVEVYLVKVQENGPEAQNCNSSFHTWQLWLSATQGNDLSKALVADITPRIAANHTGWTLDKLNALIGTKIRVSGWLLFNEDQAGEVGKSRVSLWEIHPVMQISVAKGNQWVKLDDYQP